MRTIEQLEEDDQLLGPPLSDILAFCIVASDYLRAKRRRFPKTLFLPYDLIRGFPSDRTIDNRTYYYTQQYTYEVFAENKYCNHGDISYGYYLWDYYKEYVDD